MTYTEVLAYMFECLPMYQRIGSAAYKADLENTIALMELLNKPYEHFKSIHIAGTNGKGSSSHSLASILQEKGYKTGLYTSPHLRDFRERIRVNGQMIPESKVIQFIEQYKNDFERIRPSFFEMTVGMAFQHFYEEKVEIAVIEVGMGGRLDSTNVILPELSVITNIGLDHTTFLGNTLADIAKEKAGIIKNGVPVVIGQSSTETDPVFIEKSKISGSPVFFADQTFRVENKSTPSSSGMLADIYKNDSSIMKDLHYPLGGWYQAHNLATVFQAIDVWNQHHEPLSEEIIRRGLEKTVINTGLKGRWQVLSNKPLIVCDTGHNKDGIEIIMHQINQISYEKLHFVLGVVNDKDLDGILPLFPVQAHYYFCKPDIPRGLDPDILKAKAETYHLKGEVYSRVENALHEAKKNASDNDMIFIGGSTFVVAEIC